MKRDKYMGMDVHQATTVVAVMNTEGKLVLETMVPTAATPIRGLIESLSGAVACDAGGEHTGRVAARGDSRLGEGSRGV